MKVETDRNYIVHADAETLLNHLEPLTFQMVYIDPPFNTHKTQARGNYRYSDTFEDYESFLLPKIEKARELLTDDGTMYVHLDWREAHYIKVALDKVFGRKNFLNEIIWAYDFGGRAKDRWPAKHDTILVYTKNVKQHFFDQDAVERIPYMAPGLVGPEKAARGKLPTDVWWHTIVGTGSKEKTGYPTQKPAGIVERAIQASSEPEKRVLDFFGGSGTTAHVAQKHGRKFLTGDQNVDAINVMKERLSTKADIPVEIVQL